MNRDIFMCIRDQDKEGLRDLLEKGVNPNGYNSIGNTPLIEAVMRDSVSMMEILISHGADIHIKDRDVLATPLHYATLDRISRRPMELLCKNGAYLNSRDHRGRTPFDWAYDEGAYHKCEGLLELGAKVNLIKRIMFWMKN